MPATRTSLTDLMANLGANQQAYAHGCANMHDAFNKHLLQQLATKRRRPMAELNRALLITGGLPYNAATVPAPTVSTPEPATLANDHAVLAAMERNEELTRALYADLLCSDGLTTGIRKLLEEQMRATNAILVIIGEAIRAGAERAA